MKKVSRLLLVLPFITASIAQEGGSSGFTVASRSAHETVWQRVAWETNQLARDVVRTNEFVELATGLNWLNETTQQWQPSREEWEVYADGIVARYGQHKVILATNLNLNGAVDVLLPDGATRLISSPVSLGFYDPVDGKQVVIAEVRDCAAERGTAVNEIVFRNCLDRIRGSIRFLYTKAGVHQHVVLEQKLELPDGFSDKSRLECYTVFAPETPWPQITTRVLRREADPALRAQMVEPDVMDSEITFGGAMAMRAGKAFSLGDETEARSIRVGKQFVEIEGTPVLIEAVEFKPLEPLLARLASVEQPNTEGQAINLSRQIKRAKEQARLPREYFRGLGEAKEVQLASNPLSQPAVVIDWELLSSSTLTLKGDTTYFVTNVVNLTSPIIEGGVVVKFSTNGLAKINLYEGVDCRTDAYLPAIFTVQSDNTVGQVLPGSTGVPIATSGGLILNVPDEGGSFVLENVRFSYFNQAVGAFRNQAGDWGDVSVLRHAQFINCAVPVHVENAPVSLQNVLATGCSRFLEGALGEETTEIETYIHAEHVTVRDCGALTYQDYGATYLTLTNSLLVGVTNWGNFGSITTNHVVKLPIADSVLQTVGAGAHYLVNGSTNRNAGTTNINADLLAALRKKTTYPPVLLSNVTITASTNLLPQASRDTDVPDLGYHYDPLDFIVAQCIVTNATLNLSNGVAIGYYNRSAGIWLQDNSAINSIGSPLSPNWFAHYTLVQEQPVFIGDTPLISALAVNSYHYGSTGPMGLYRFTHFASPGGAYILIHSTAWAYSNLLVQDCQFWNGWNYLEGANGSVAVLKNNLFQRSSLGAFATASTTLTLSNNLVRQVAVDLLNEDGANLWRIHNNAFDQCEVPAYVALTNSHNAYINCSGRLTPTNVNDVVLSSLNYASGPLGDFYQAANSQLSDKGSSPADDTGLYHYTTTTAQVMETNSIMDIGFHYVALNTNGVPFDTDGDGIPDYLDSDSTPRTDIVWSNGVWQWKGNSLAWNCWTNALVCTNGAQGNFYNIFSNFSMANQRNTNFWFRHFKGWPAYSVWNNCSTNEWPTNINQTCSGGYTWHGAGVLVSPEHVLTTGHMGFPSNQWLVRVDSRQKVTEGGSH